MTSTAPVPPTSTRQDDVTAPARPRPSIAELAARYGLQLFTLLAFIVVGALLPNFRALPNLQDILLQASFAGLAGVGMTLLIIGGVIDLSVAGIIAITAVVLAQLIPVVPLPVAVLAALGVGVLLGLVNGLIVAKLRFPPFIATYAMLNVYLAVAFVLTNAQTIGVTNESFLEFSSVAVLGVPAMFVLLIVAAVGCWLLLTRTRFGRNLRALGSSEAASRMAGLPVDHTRVIAFVIFGVLCAVAALGLASLLSSASADMSIGFELNVVAVAVVGGTSLLGGSGTMLGTVTAAILFSGLNNALNLFGVASYWQYVAAGIVLVAALVVAGRRELVLRRDA